MGTVGYAHEDELEKVFAIGDIVKPIPACIGKKDIFKIVSCNDNNKYNLKQLTHNGRELDICELANWSYDILQKVPLPECPMDIVTQQVLTNMKPVYIDKVQNQIIGYDPILNEEGENYMKILGIYSRKAHFVIEKKYDELEKEVRENDNVNKIIQDASNQINVLLDRDEKNAISLVPSGIYSELLEPNNSEKILELKRDREREERNIEKLMEEVEARLEICDDDEYSKTEVLKAYGILTSEGKIAEYKTEKKGKK